MMSTIKHLRLNNYKTISQIKTLKYSIIRILSIYSFTLGGKKLVMSFPKVIKSLAPVDEI